MSADSHKTAEAMESDECERCLQSELRSRLGTLQTQTDEPTNTLCLHTDQSVLSLYLSSCSTSFSLTDLVVSVPQTDEVQFTASMHTKHSAFIPTNCFHEIIIATAPVDNACRHLSTPSVYYTIGNEVSN